MKKGYVEQDECDYHEYSQGQGRKKFKEHIQSRSYKDDRDVYKNVEVTPGRVNCQHKVLKREVWIMEEK